MKKQLCSMPFEESPQEDLTAKHDVLDYNSNASLLRVSTLGATFRKNWLSTLASNSAAVLAGTVDGPLARDPIFRNMEPMVPRLMRPMCCRGCTQFEKSDQAPIERLIQRISSLKTMHVLDIHDATSKKNFVQGQRETSGPLDEHQHICLMNKNTKRNVTSFSKIFLDQHKIFQVRWNSNTINTEYPVVYTQCTVAKDTLRPDNLPNPTLIPPNGTTVRILRLILPGE